MQDVLKISKACIIGVPKGEQKENDAETIFKVFKEMLVKNLPELTKNNPDVLMNFKQLINICI